MCHCYTSQRKHSTKGCSDTKKQSDKIPLIMKTTIAKTMLSPMNILGNLINIVAKM